MNAAVGRCARVGPAAVLGLFVPTSAEAQENSAAPGTMTENVAVDTMKFLAGGLLGLGMREGGHLKNRRSAGFHPSTSLGMP
jgi:hypothetical protein